MEILVGLISDEYTNVANKSRKILNIFTHTHLGPECRPLVEMLEENLHNLSTSLPRIIRCVGKIVFNKFYQLYAKDRSRLLYKLNFTILIISLVIELYFNITCSKKENSEITFTVFADENRKFSALSLMSGYIDLLGKL